MGNQRGEVVTGVMVVMMVVMMIFGMSFMHGGHKDHGDRKDHGNNEQKHMDHDHENTKKSTRSETVETK